MTAMPTPKIGQIVHVGPNTSVTTPAGDRTWKAAFRMRVTEVTRTRGVVIIGGTVINKDGADRVRTGTPVTCAVDGSAVTEIEGAAPTPGDDVPVIPDVTEVRAALAEAGDQAEAYAYVVGLGLTVADMRRLATALEISFPGGVTRDALVRLIVRWTVGARMNSRTISRPAHESAPVAAPEAAPVTPVDQGAYVSGPMAADVTDETRALVARADVNARRTADQTADAFLGMAGRDVTVHRVTTYDQVLTSGIDDDDTVISYRPRIKAESGTVTDIDVHGQSVTVTLTSVTADASYAWTHTVRLVGSDHPMGNATPYAVDVVPDQASDAGTAVEASPDQPADQAPGHTEPVMIEYPADVMAEARTLRTGDHVSGRTSDRKYFDGYLCADPSAGHDQRGSQAVVLMLASAPVEGAGGRWCVTGSARFMRLPADPAVVAEGETMSAMRAMRRAGYVVKGARCDKLTAHYAHIYRRPSAGTKERFACRGLVIDMTPDQGDPEMRAATEVMVARTRAAVPVPAPVPAPPVATVAPVAIESEASMPETTTPTTTPTTVPAGHLVATVDRAALIEALSYAVKAAPGKGAPEYAAVTFTADGAYAVTVTARGWDAVMTVTLDASVAVTGTVMINAKGLLKLARATPAPKGKKALPTMVTLAHQGDQVTVTAGATALVADAVTSTLNLGPLPVVPSVAVQTASVADFADSVTRAITAAGTDDTLRNLMGVQVTTTNEGNRLIMQSTDRYRAAEVIMPVTYHLDTETDAREHVTAGLVPATYLGLVGVVASKSGADTVDMCTFASNGDTWFGYRFGRYAFALQAIDGPLPNLAALFPTTTNGHVTVNAEALAAMIDRVATVGQGAPGAMSLTVAADTHGDVTGISAYLLKTGARETMPATGRAADGFNIGINPTYASVALRAATGDATLSFVDNRTPITITGESARYRALVIPIRLDGSTCDTPAPAARPAPVATQAPAAPVEAAEAVTPVAPVDVYTADQVTAAGAALVTVHGRNGNGEARTLTGTVRNVTPCLAGRVKGLVRVSLDNGHTIYVSVTATPKEDAMTSTETTTTEATPANNANAERIAARAFGLAESRQYADARTAMAEAAALVPAGYLYGRKPGAKGVTLDQILALVDTHEATGTFRPVAAPVTEAEAPVEAPAAPAAEADDTATVRDILSRSAWSGASVDGRSVDILSLPSGVARAAYLAVKAVVAPMGGTWVKKTVKRPGGFAFAAPVTVWSTGGSTLSGRERVNAWLADGTVTPAETTEATPAEAVPVDRTAVAAVVAEVPAEVPAEVKLPTVEAVEAAYAAGYAAALATVQTSPVPAAEATAVPADGRQFTFGEWSVTGVTYNDARALVVDAIGAAGIAGVTVVKVARKGADRNKIIVSAPAADRARVYALVAASIAAMLPADSNA